LEDIFVGQLSLIGCHQGWRHRTIQGVFHDLRILVLAEQDTDAGVLVLFFHVAVEGFEIEVELAEVFGFEFFGF
jgi:hypothetical protein